MENLWNVDIINKKEPTPKEILAIQANFLDEMTNGKLVASIRTVSAHPFLDKDASEFNDECFIHSFHIKVPSLDYTFTLLRLVHETIRVKPFQLYSNLTDKKYISDDIKELEKILKEIFGSKEVTGALTNLLSQAQGE
jgi:hypothetical protein